MFRAMPYPTLFMFQFEGLAVSENSPDTPATEVVYLRGLKIHLRSSIYLPGLPGDVYVTPLASRLRIKENSEIKEQKEVLVETLKGHQFSVNSLWLQ